MIRYGIAGIPLTSKGRTFIDSVEEIYKLGLKALEVQLLRVNIQENQGIEYVGMLPKDNENSIIINVLRPNDEGVYSNVGTDTVIQEDDIVQELFWNMAKNYDELKEGGELAKELDVLLSLHSPYYMDLLNGSKSSNEEDISERSINHLKWSMIIGKAMNAKRVVTHTGFYADPKKTSLKKATDIYSAVTKEMSIEHGFPYIGVETSGKPEIFGSAEDVISLSKKISSVEPILNIPHYHARNNGSLIQAKDFKEVLDKFKARAKGDLYVEYAGVEYNGSTETKLMAIKHGDLKFETLSEVILDYQDDLTIISSSPLLEHDAQYMEIIFGRNFARHLQRKKEKGKEK
jgi:deoxyribonuclease-4